MCSPLSYTPHSFLLLNHEVRHGRPSEPSLSQQELVTLPTPTHMERKLWQLLCSRLGSALRTFPPLIQWWVVSESKAKRLYMGCGIYQINVLKNHSYLVVRLGFWGWARLTEAEPFQCKPLSQKSAMGFCCVQHSDPSWLGPGMQEERNSGPLFPGVDSNYFNLITEIPFQSPYLSNNRLSQSLHSLKWLPLEIFVI